MVCIRILLIPLALVRTTQFSTLLHMLACYPTAPCVCLFFQNTFGDAEEPWLWFKRLCIPWSVAWCTYNRGVYTC